MPVDLLQQPFLNHVDMLIRQGVREICGLPADISIPVFYSGRKVCGLGMIRLRTSCLQHFAIAQKHYEINNLSLKSIRDLTDIVNCLHLENVTGQNAQAFRTELLAGKFNKWK